MTKDTVALRAQDIHNAIQQFNAALDKAEHGEPPLVADLDLKGRPKRLEVLSIDTAPMPVNVWSPPDEEGDE